MLEEENKGEILEKEENIENENSEENTTNESSVKAELEETTDRLKRLMAEFDNFKKRSAKEREGLYNSILSDIVSSLLPVVDNLENAVNVSTEDVNYKQGVELVEKQFKEFLSKNNVEEIPAIGEMFDPSVHEAVGSAQDETKQNGEIVQEYRKGYKLGSKILRHSMVIVNQ